MKKLLAIIILFASVGSINAQLIKLTDVKAVEKTKLIVGLSGNQAQDDALKKALKDFWTLSEIGESMPTKEAKTKAKANDKLFVISVGLSTGKSLTHSDGGGNLYRYVAKGIHLEISNGKKVVIKQYLPAFGEERAITEEILASALTSVQYLCNTMVKKSMKNNMKYKNAYKVNSPKLKSKTLYIAEGWVDEKMKESVASLYNGKVEVVSYEKWRDVILSKKEGAAYSIVIPVLVGADYLYQHYLIDASSGIVYGIAIPKAASANLGRVKVNLSKANNGYVNKKILEKYNGVLIGKW